MVQAERVSEHVKSRLPQATEMAIGGASRETWSFDAGRRDGGKGIERLG